MIRFIKSVNYLNLRIYVIKSRTAAGNYSKDAFSIGVDIITNTYYYYYFFFRYNYFYYYYDRLYYFIMLFYIITIICIIILLLQLLLLLLLLLSPRHLVISVIGEGFISALEDANPTWDLSSPNEFVLFKGKTPKYIKLSVHYYEVRTYFNTNDEIDRNVLLNNNNTI